MALMRILQVGNAQMRRFGAARVSTETKLLNELIGEDTAVFFESDGDLLNKVKAYANDAAARKSVAAKGRQFYREHFTSERVARALHQHGNRAGEPFVAVNVAAIPRELLEAELFGHERGAFTGAHARRAGRFEQAAGGTLFLDEVGDMPQNLQTRLLRVLSEGEYYRVGGSQPLHTDARIIAATHQDLATRVRNGDFREDLLHRLDVVRIAVPPLSERREDIGPLAEHFLAKAALEAGTPTKRLAPDTVAALRRRPWPGNVRELENLCRRLTVLTPGPVIQPADLPDAEGVSTADPSLEHAISEWFHANSDALNGAIWPEASRRLETALIRLALEVSRGRRGEAARLLGMGRNTLARKLRGEES
jgi:two-component system nitrogen regulation response regulator GlnG